MIIFAKDYDYLKLDMNGACVADPALIVQPISDMDVSRAVLAGTRSGLMISVRGGGHSYTCNSVKNGSLQIDMRLMNSISLLEDTGASTGLVAVLEAGATWGQVLREIPPTTYSYPHGQCRSVGVGGFLLGGGLNWLGTYNKYGYGAEHVLKMNAVLADGSIAEVTPDSTSIIYPQSETIVHTEDNNLFFALRGAGSSFAVVTRFRYLIHNTPETLPAILLAWADSPADLENIQVR